MLHVAKGLMQTCGLKSAPGSAWALTAPLWADFFPVPHQWGLPVKRDACLASAAAYKCLPSYLEDFTTLIGMKPQVQCVASYKQHAIIELRNIFLSS